MVVPLRPELVLVARHEAVDADVVLDREDAVDVVADVAVVARKETRNGCR